MDNIITAILTTIIVFLITSVIWDGIANERVEKTVDCMYRTFSGEFCLGNYNIEIQ